MKTILVPVDFSETAKNAAPYALQLASQSNAKKVILYNAYQPPPVIAETAMMPAAAMPFFDVEDYANISNTSIGRFKDSIQSFCPAGIDIELQTEYAEIENDINNVCEKTNASLIVMGITVTSKIEEMLAGSTAITVMKNTTVPVIIVPAGARYTAINNVMLACDFKKVVETLPLQPLKNILDATKARLHIANVYESEKTITANKSYQQELLNSLLKEYSPQFHFEYNEDFMAGINNLTEANNIDLIITIPKKARFF